MFNTMQEKEQALIALGKFYRKGMIIEQSLSEIFGYHNEMDEITKIREVLRKMDEEYAIIIINDFITPNDKNWWQHQYIRSVYYRRQRLAIDQFFNKAKDINLHAILKGCV